MLLYKYLQVFCEALVLLDVLRLDRLASPPEGLLLAVRDVLS